MANQMIALGVRGPQLPDLGRAMSQYGAMMNTMAQQRASQRQAEQAAQTMDIARRQEARAVEAHEIEQAGKQIEYYTTLAGQTMNRAGYERLLARLDTDAPEIADQFRTNLPPENFDRNALLQMVGSIGDNFRARFGPLETQVVQADDGTFMVARTGGVQEPGVFELPEYALRPSGAATAPPAASGQPAQQPMSFEEAFSNLRSDALTPEQAAPILGNAARTGVINQSDVDRLRSSLPPEGRPQVDEFIRQRGITVNPINFVPGSSGQQPVAPLTMETAPQIIQNAVQNRTIDESHLQQLRQMVGPENEQALAQWMQQNGVRIQPAGQPTMRTAEYRPGQGAAPQMTQVQSMDNYVPTGRAARGRDMRVGQVPGSAVVPLPRVQGESAAQTAGSENVRVTTQPQITRGVQRAERLERLLGDLPRARGETQVLVDNLADRIDRIDQFLRSPYRRSIMGAIEGRLGGFTEARADELADWNYITNNAILDKLIADRQSTETGASPQGLVSDRDILIAAQAASALSRSGSEPEQERELRRLRDVLYRTRENALRTFNDTYAEVFRERPELRVHARPVPPIYRAQPPETQQPEPRKTSRGARVFGVRGGR